MIPVTTTTIHPENHQTVTAELLKQKGTGRYSADIVVDGIRVLSLFLTLDQIETLTDSFVGEVCKARNDEPIPTSVIDWPHNPLTEFDGPEGTAA